MKRVEEVMPSKRIRGEFRLIYELEGAQKAVNFLCQYYGIRRMKILVDGRSIGKRSWDACYDNHVAYFKKKKIDKHLVLHEFYHHLSYVNEWNMKEKIEEREADKYANEILKGCRKV